MKVFQLNFISLLLMVSVLFSSSIFAQDSLNAGQAVTLCKEEIAERHADHSRSKTSNIKERRGIFNIKLRVYLAEKSIVANCTVNQDGTVILESS